MTSNQKHQDVSDLSYLLRPVDTRAAIGGNAFYTALDQLWKDTTAPPLRGTDRHYVPEGFTADSNGNLIAKNAAVASAVDPSPATDTTSTTQQRHYVNPNKYAGRAIASLLNKYVLPAEEEKARLAAEAEQKAKEEAEAAAAAAALTAGGEGNTNNGGKATPALTAPATASTTKPSAKKGGAAAKPNKAQLAEEERLRQLEEARKKEEEAERRRKEEEETLALIKNRPRDIWVETAKAHQEEYEAFVASLVPHFNWAQQRDEYFSQRPASEYLIEDILGENFGEEEEEEGEAAGAEHTFTNKKSSTTSAHQQQQRMRVPPSPRDDLTVDAIGYAKRRLAMLEQTLGYKIPRGMHRVGRDGEDYGTATGDEDDKQNKNKSVTIISAKDEGSVAEGKKDGGEADHIALLFSQHHSGGTLESEPFICANTLKQNAMATQTAAEAKLAEEAKALAESIHLEKIATKSSMANKQMQSSYSSSSAAAALTHSPKPPAGNSPATKSRGGIYNSGGGAADASLGNISLNFSGTFNNTPTTSTTASVDSLIEVSSREIAFVDTHPFSTYAQRVTVWNRDKSARRLRLHASPSPLIAITPIDCGIDGAAKKKRRPYDPAKPLVMGETLVFEVAFTPVDVLETEFVIKIAHTREMNGSKGADATSAVWTDTAIRVCCYGAKPELDLVTHPQSSLPTYNTSGSGGKTTAKAGGEEVNPSFAKIQKLRAFFNEHAYSLLPLSRAVAAVRRDCAESIGRRIASEVASSVVPISVATKTTSGTNNTNSSVITSTSGGGGAAGAADTSLLHRTSTLEMPKASAGTRTDRKKETERAVTELSADALASLAANNYISFEPCFLFSRVIKKVTLYNSGSSGVFRFEVQTGATNQSNNNNADDDEDSRLGLNKDITNVISGNDDALQSHNSNKNPFRVVPSQIAIASGAYATVDIYFEPREAALFSAGFVKDPLFMYYNAHHQEKHIGGGGGGLGVINVTPNASVTANDNGDDASSHLPDPLRHRQFAQLAVSAWLDLDGKKKMVAHPSTSASSPSLSVVANHSTFPRRGVVPTPYETADASPDTTAPVAQFTIGIEAIAVAPTVSILKLGGTDLSLGTNNNANTTSTTTGVNAESIVSPSSSDDDDDNDDGDDDQQEAREDARRRRTNALLLAQCPVIHFKDACVGHTASRVVTVSNQGPIPIDFVWDTQATTQATTTTGGGTNANATAADQTDQQQQGIAIVPASGTLPANSSVSFTVSLFAGSTASIEGLLKLMLLGLPDPALSLAREAELKKLLLLAEKKKDDDDDDESIERRLMRRAVEIRDGPIRALSRAKAIPTLTVAEPTAVDPFIAFTPTRSKRQQQQPTNNAVVATKIVATGLGAVRGGASILNKGNINDVEAADDAFAATPSRKTHRTSISTAANARMTARTITQTTLIAARNHFANAAVAAAANGAPSSSSLCDERQRQHTSTNEYSSKANDNNKRNQSRVSQQQQQASFKLNNDANTSSVLIEGSREQHFYPTAFIHPNTQNNSSSFNHAEAKDEQQHLLDEIVETLLLARAPLFAAAVRCLADPTTAVVSITPSQIVDKFACLTNCENLREFQLTNHSNKPQRFWIDPPQGEAHPRVDAEQQLRQLMLASAANPSASNQQQQQEQQRAAADALRLAIDSLPTAHNSERANCSLQLRPARGVIPPNATITVSCIVTLLKEGTHFIDVEVYLPDLEEAAAIAAMTTTTATVTAATSANTTSSSLSPSSPLSIRIPSLSQHLTLVTPAVGPAVSMSTTLLDLGVIPLNDEGEGRVTLTNNNPIPIIVRIYDPESKRNNPFYDRDDDNGNDSGKDSDTDDESEKKKQKVKSDEEKKEKKAVAAAAAATEKFACLPAITKLRPGDAVDVTIFRRGLTPEHVQERIHFYVEGGQTTSIEVHALVQKASVSLLPSILSFGDVHREVPAEKEVLLSNNSPIDLQYELHVVGADSSNGTNSNGSGAVTPPPPKIVLPPPGVLRAGQSRLPLPITATFFGTATDSPQTALVVLTSPQLDDPIPLEIRCDRVLQLSVSLDVLVPPRNGPMAMLMTSASGGDFNNFFSSSASSVGGGGSRPPSSASSAKRNIATRSRKGERMRQKLLGLVTGNGAGEANSNQNNSASSPSSAASLNFIRVTQTVKEFVRDVILNLVEAAMTSSNGHGGDGMVTPLPSVDFITSAKPSASSTAIVVVPPSSISSSAVTAPSSSSQAAAVVTRIKPYCPDIHVPFATITDDRPFVATTAIIRVSNQSECSANYRLGAVVFKAMEATTTTVAVGAEKEKDSTANANNNTVTAVAAGGALKAARSANTKKEGTTAAATTITMTNTTNKGATALLATTTATNGGGGDISDAPYQIPLSSIAPLRGGVVGGKDGRHTTATATNASAAAIIPKSLVKQLDGREAWEEHEASRLRDASAILVDSKGCSILVSGGEGALGARESRDVSLTVMANLPGVYKDQINVAVEGLPTVSIGVEMAVRGKVVLLDPATSGLAIGGDQLAAAQEHAGGRGSSSSSSHHRSAIPRLMLPAIVAGAKKVSRRLRLTSRCPRDVEVYARFVNADQFYTLRVVEKELIGAPIGNGVTTDLLWAEVAENQKLNSGHPSSSPPPRVATRGDANVMQSNAGAKSTLSATRGSGSGGAVDVILDTPQLSTKDFFATAADSLGGMGGVGGPSGGTAGSRNPSLGFANNNQQQQPNNSNDGMNPHTIREHSACTPSRFLLKAMASIEVTIEYAPPPGSTNDWRAMLVIASRIANTSYNDAFIVDEFYRKYGEAKGFVPFTRTLCPETLVVNDAKSRLINIRGVNKVASRVPFINREGIIKDSVVIGGIEEDAAVKAERVGRRLSMQQHQQGEGESNGNNNKKQQRGKPSRGGGKGEEEGLNNASDVDHYDHDDDDEDANDSDNDNNVLLHAATTGTTTKGSGFLLQPPRSSHGISSNHNNATSTSASVVPSFSQRAQQQHRNSASSSSSRHMVVMLSGEQQATAASAASSSSPSSAEASAKMDAEIQQRMREARLKAQAIEDERAAVRAYIRQRRLELQKESEDFFTPIEVLVVAKNIEPKLQADPANEIAFPLCTTSSALANPKTLVSSSFNAIGMKKQNHRTLKLTNNNTVPLTFMLELTSPDESDPLKNKVRLVGQDDDNDDNENNNQKQVQEETDEEDAKQQADNINNTMTQTKKKTHQRRRNVFFIQKVDYIPYDRHQMVIGANGENLTKKINTATTATTTSPYSATTTNNKKTTAAPSHPNSNSFKLARSGQPTLFTILPNDTIDITIALNPARAETFIANRSAMLLQKSNEDGGEGVEDAATLLHRLATTTTTTSSAGAANGSGLSIESVTDDQYLKLVLTAARQNIDGCMRVVFVDNTTTTADTATTNVDPAASSSNNNHNNSIVQRKRSTIVAAASPSNLYYQSFPLHATMNIPYLVPSPNQSLFRPMGTVKDGRPNQHFPQTITLYNYSLVDAAFTIEHVPSDTFNATRLKTIKQREQDAAEEAADLKLGVVKSDSKLLLLTTSASSAVVDGSGGNGAENEEEEEEPFTMPQATMKEKVTTLPNAPHLGLLPAVSHGIKKMNTWCRNKEEDEKKEKEAGEKKKNAKNLVAAAEATEGTDALLPQPSRPSTTNNNAANSPSGNNTKGAAAGGGKSKPTTASAAAAPQKGAKGGPVGNNAAKNAAANNSKSNPATKNNATAATASSSSARPESAPLTLLNGGGGAPTDSAAAVAAMQTTNNNGTTDSTTAAPLVTSIINAKEHAVKHLFENIHEKIDDPTHFTIEPTSGVVPAATIGGAPGMLQISVTFTETTKAFFESMFKVVSTVPFANASSSAVAAAASDDNILSEYVQQQVKEQLLPPATFILRGESAEVELK